MLVFGERIKHLRKEKKWRQAELAEKINADARQISRYEKGKINPSVETLVRIAQVFDVTIDYLLIENANKKPFQLEDKELFKYIEDLQKLGEEDRRCLFHIIDSFMTKNKIKSFAQEID
jgi:transcriptional regulator with XRE-family HTH domain